jgi:hypothetical protein
MTETTAQQEEQASVDLTVQDLAGLRSIIDIASSRGAFKAAEMEAVGKLFNKLNAFLETVAKQQQAQAPAPAEGQ